MPTHRQQLGRYGGLRSWANTIDRTARTAAGRSAGPASVDYHLARLDARFDTATDAQRLAAAEAARGAYYAALALKSAAARRQRSAGGDAA